MNIFQRLTYLSEHMAAGEVPEFRGFLMQFIGKSDEETLDKLLHLFNDTCPFPESMYTLVHLVETWPCDIYVKGILTHVSSLSSLAPFWLKTLVASIFNHKQGLVLFRQNMHLAPKEDLLKLFDLMEKDSPHHPQATLPQPPLTSLLHPLLPSPPRHPRILLLRHPRIYCEDLSEDLTELLLPTSNANKLSWQTYTML